MNRARTGPTGVGLGLRWDFLTDLLEADASSIDFVEISPENYMGRGGFFPAALERAASRFPVITHGLTMSLGGVDDFNPVYLRELRAFVARFESPFHSDHLCFGSSGGRVLHDLLPITFTEATVTRVADRVRRAQDALGVPMAVENISFYMHPGKAQMGEAEFIARVCDRADCGLLLDVNNAYVNAQNFGFDVDAWLRTVPLERVVQMHVAGHEAFDDDRDDDDRDDDDTADETRPRGSLIIDTHGAEVGDPVLGLLERVLQKIGPVPVLLERDMNVPPFAELLAEVARIKALWTRATSTRA